jgi:hypothetical protein
MAARFPGAVLREIMGAPLTLYERADRDHVVAAVHVALSDAPIAAARAEGKAIVYALEGTPNGSGTPGGTE